MTLNALLKLTSMTVSSLQVAAGPDSDSLIFILLFSRGRNASVLIKVFPSAGFYVIQQIFNFISFSAGLPFTPGSCAWMCLSHLLRGNNFTKKVPLICSV